MLPSTVTEGEITTLEPNDSLFHTVTSRKIAESAESEEARTMNEVQFVNPEEKALKFVKPVEETERMKKRQRAEQIFSLEYDNDTVDAELPQKTTMDKV